MLYGSQFLSFRQKLVKASEYSLCPIIDHFLYHSLLPPFASIFTPVRVKAKRLCLSICVCVRVIKKHGYLLSYRSKIATEWLSTAQYCDSYSWNDA